MSVLASFTRQRAVMCVAVGGSLCPISSRPALSLASVALLSVHTRTNIAQPALVSFTPLSRSHPCITRRLFPTGFFTAAPLRQVS